MLHKLVVNTELSFYVADFWKLIAILLKDTSNLYNVTLMYSYSVLHSVLNSDFLPASPPLPHSVVVLVAFGCFCFTLLSCFLLCLGGACGIKQHACIAQSNFHLPFSHCSLCH